MMSNLPDEPQSKGPRVADERIVRLHFRVLDRRRGIGGDRTFGINVSADDEVHPDWDVRVGARFQLLRDHLKPAQSRQRGQRSATNPFHSDVNWQWSFPGQFDSTHGPAPK